MGNIDVRHDTGYGLVPRRVMRDSGLSSTAKTVYCYLASFAGNTGKSFPSTGLMAKELNLSKNTLFKYLRELRDKQVITVERERVEGNKFGKNIYYLHNKIGESISDSPCTKSSYMENEDIEKQYMENEDTNSNRFNSNNINSNNNTNIYTDNSKEKESQITEEEKKVQSIYEEWKKANIINHRRITRAMKTKIKSALKDYTEEEIKQSIRNYSYIVNNDNYFFSHRWTLDQFCTITQKDRIGNFLDLEVAKNNYRANKGDIGNGGNERHNIKNEDDSRKEYEEFEAEYFEKWKI